MIDPMSELSTKSSAGAAVPGAWGPGVPDGEGPALAACKARDMGHFRNVCSASFRSGIFASKLSMIDRLSEWCSKLSAGAAVPALLVAVVPDVEGAAQEVEGGVGGMQSCMVGLVRHSNMSLYPSPTCV